MEIKMEIKWQHLHVPWTIAWNAYLIFMVAQGALAGAVHKELEHAALRH